MIRRGAGGVLGVFYCHAALSSSALVEFVQRERGPPGGSGLDEKEKRRRGTKIWYMVQEKTRKYSVNDCTARVRYDVMIVFWREGLTDRKKVSEIIEEVN